MKIQATPVQAIAPMASGLNKNRETQCDIDFFHYFQSTDQLSLGVPNQHGIRRTAPTISTQAQTGNSRCTCVNRLCKFCPASSKKTTPVYLFRYLDHQEKIV